MEPMHAEEGLEVLSSLADPTRRRLYLLAVARPGGVGRDEAAQIVGISRGLAAFHLDRLIADGLLVAGYRRLTGRTGPGAGRPSKIYRRSDREVSISIPRRNHELLARLFAQAFSTDEEPGEALLTAARALGRSLGEETRHRFDAPGAEAPVLLQAAAALLEAEGFDPLVDDDGRLALGNCPFSPIAGEYMDLVCHANLALIQGVVSGLQLKGVGARMERRPGGCCVALIPDSQHAGVRDQSHPS